MSAFPALSHAALSHAALAALAARPHVPLALATLVEVEGSSYRQPGARLLVDAEGRVLAGAISGGCLEADVASHAARVTADGAAVLRYDLQHDLEAIWGFGSACDGIATILLEPLHGSAWLAAVDAERAARRSGSLVTRYHAYGAAVADVAAAASEMGTTLVREADHPQGDTWPHAVQDAMAIARRTGRPQLVAMHDDARALVEPVLPPVALYVVGAGRGAEAFARIAHAVGWHTTVIDHRAELLDGLALPHGVDRLVGRADLAATLPLDGRTAVALLTHMFELDADWLAQLLARPAAAIAYIGVLGSRQRGARLVERLGLGAEQAARLHAPIGLDLGGESPESIALATIAEIEAVLHARPGGSLRERQSPIHERTATPARRPVVPAR